MTNANDEPRATNSQPSDQPTSPPRATQAEDTGASGRESDTTAAHAVPAEEPAPSSVIRTPVLAVDPTTGVDPEDEDEEDDDGPVTFTTGEALGAFATVWRFLRPHLSGHSVGLTLVGIGLAIETAFNVLMPLSLKFFIDEVMESDERTEFSTVIIVLGLAGLVTSITAVWYERKDAEVTAAIVADIRRRLFRHIQNLTADYFSRTRTGEITARFSNDLTTVEETVLHAANWGVLPFAELVAGIILLFFLAWPLALLALLIFPIALIGPRLIAPRAIEASYDLKRAQAGMLGVVNEQVSASSVVKAFGLQRMGRRWFNLRSDAVRTSMTRSTFLGTMVERSVTIAMLMLHLCVFGVGAWLTFNEMISLGAFVTFEGVFWEISYNVAHLMQFVPVVIHSAGAVRHIEEVLQQPVEAPEEGEIEALERLQTSIRFENVSFSYGAMADKDDEGDAEEGEDDEDDEDEDEDEDEDVDALQIDNLSLYIEAGRHVAIVGPSGAGKSTLINLLLRLYEPTAGRIRIDGTDVASVAPDALRRQMAVVFQDSILFSTTIMENIRLGRTDATDEEVMAAAQAAEMHKFITSLPLGYETIVGERGASLSGGQRQRIAIARAVLRDPAILLLDEATSALDQTTENAILRTLRRVGQGRTMIFVTHRLTTVTDFDDIIVMRDGRAAQRGTHAQLVAKKGLYRQLWADQQRRSSGA
jgi:ATP-binding cassette subfamily B protein